MALAIAACLVMTVVGGLLPFLQGWIFFVIALYLLVTEFHTGRVWVKNARRRWPWLSRLIEKARTHRWAPRHLKEFEEPDGSRQIALSSPEKTEDGGNA